MLSLFSFKFDQKFSCKNISIKLLFEGEPCLCSIIFLPNFNLVFIVDMSLTNSVKYDIKSQNYPVPSLLL